MDDRTDTPQAVSNLVAELAGSGERIPGSFTLARDKAKESLKQFTLADPSRYVLLIVRSAIRRGASRMDVEIGPRSLTVQFDGRPVTQADIDKLYDAVYQPQADSDGLRELALGLSVAHNLGFEQVTLVSGTGDGAVSLEMRRDADDRISTPDKGVPGIRIVIQGKFPAAQAKGPERPEPPLLHERCQYAPLTLRVNGISVAHGLTLPDATHPQTFEGEGFSGVAGFRPPYTEPGQVRFVVDGAWVSETAGQPTGHGFVAVVDMGSAQLDASEHELVQDDRYHRAVRSVAKIHSSYTTGGRWPHLQKEMSSFQTQHIHRVVDGLARLYLRRRIAYFVVIFCLGYSFWFLLGGLKTGRFGLGLWHFLVYAPLCSVFFSFTLGRVLENDALHKLLYGSLEARFLEHFPMKYPLQKQAKKRAHYYKEKRFGYYNFGHMLEFAGEK